MLTKSNLVEWLKEINKVETAILLQRGTLLKYIICERITSKVIIIKDMKKIDAAIRFG